jgi:hypothetical protein
VALDDALHLVGYAVIVLVSDPTQEPYAHVWQVYLRPGSVRLREVYTAAWEKIEEWARGHGVSRFMCLTFRKDRAYIRKLETFGFKPVARVLERRL